MSFNTDFLQRQANPAELSAVVQKQGTLIQQVGQSFVRVQALDEVANEIGQLQYRALDANGSLRMIMSAINLFEQYGINAHLAGFNEDGIPQFYVSADDGSIVAGAGAVVQGQDGMNLPQPGDAISFSNDVDLGYGLISFLGTPASVTALRLVEFIVSTNTNQVSNGDFETGSLTPWAETSGAGGTSTVDAGVGYNDSYGLHLIADLALGIGDTIYQSITPVTTGVIIQFRAKAVSTAGVYLVISDNGTNTYPLRCTSTDWRNYSVILYGSISAVAFRLSSLTPAADVYLDDIVVRPLAGSTIPTGSSFEMGAGLALYTGSEFKIKGTDGNSYFKVYMYSSPRKVGINDSAADIDTVISGDTDLNLVYVDASTDRVGIGTATPAEKLDVVGNIKVSGSILGTGAPQAETNTNNIFACAAPGGISAFAGTIATLPGGAVLTYNVTSGQEGAMVPVSTSQLAKLRLYNTTRGTSALISNCVVGTNTITLTANVPAGWTVTDVITIASQTVTGGGVSWVDLEITSGPINKVSIFADLFILSATAGDIMQSHPTEAFGLNKVTQTAAYTANISCFKLCLVKLTSNVFSITWTGTPTQVTIRESGYLS